jgi:type II secretory ATPase GspE/PulE/Tfp pilus assembly ATPase PilB-like protein
MECRECDGLLVAYVKGELAEADAAIVEGHLKTCGSCRWNEEAARNTLAEVYDADAAPVCAFARTIIHRAVQERASDVHIEPDSEPKPATHDLGDPSLDAEASSSVRIRLRIDGVLHDAWRLPGYMGAPLATRFMVMSEMNPFERRVPQFGRIHIRHGDSDHDLRVGTMPGTLGMRVVLRILSKSSVLIDLPRIGLSDVNLARVREASAQPCGVLLVTGPAGGGRTTFLYSLLADLAKPGISIMTIEDPVEVRLPGATQTHVNRAAGFDYAEALKAMVRQDPDILLCGEVPGPTVADLVAQVALAGHLVLGTVAGDDAADGLKRYLDLVTDPVTASKALIGVVGLRLVRRVCRDCVREVEPSDADLAFLRGAGIEHMPPKLRRGAGCEACRGTGYKGRTGIQEVLLLDQGVRKAIRSGQPVQLRPLVRPSLQQDAAEKAAAGTTTVEEAARVTSQ